MQARMGRVVAVVASAVLIQLAQGTVYGWSVFVKPLMAANGWTRPNVTLAFGLAICFLGIAAFTTGRLADRHPRTVSSIGGGLFGLGLLLAGLAVRHHSLIGLYMAYGVLAGFGMGMAYLVPIAVAIKWVPAMRGLIAGLVVMGFGGGAVLIGSVGPGLIAHWGPEHVLMGMGGLFLVLCVLLGQVMRNPPEYVAKTVGLLSLRGVLSRGDFWILWGMLFINISAGIAMISHASPMVQEIHHRTPAEAGTILAIVAIFNGLGRVAWSAFSDRIGRRNVFMAMYATQIAVFLILPHVVGVGAFGLLFCCILFCYGGGFGTMPAYTADVFGAEVVGRVYGPLLTAWSAAGLVGPLCYALLRDFTGTYTVAMYVTAGLFVLACCLPKLPEKTAVPAIS